MVIAGKLTEKLIIKTLTVSATTLGEPVETYSTYKTIYASITNQKGNNSFNTDLPGHVYTDRISFFARYMKLPNDVKTYRIDYKGKLYKIINLTTIQRNVATVIDLEVAK